MANDDLKGIITALLVPFNADGLIDEAKLRAVVRHNVLNMKIDGLYVGGSTGETFTMGLEEKKKVLDIVMSEARGSGDLRRVALIAQVGSPNLHEAIDLGRHAVSLGYDCLSAVTPFYYKFTAPEVKDYYNAITAATGARMIVYSVPVLTGVSMGLAEFRKLFENPLIVGVKFTACDFFLLERLRSAFPNHLIFSGFDEMLLSAAVLKVDGAIGSTFNVNGPRARLIFEAAAAGRLDEAREAQRATNDLIEAVLANGLYLTLKELLRLCGVFGETPAGTIFCRPPMTKEPNPEQLKTAQEIYNKYLKQ